MTKKKYWTYYGATNFAKQASPPISPGGRSGSPYNDAFMISLRNHLRPIFKLVLSVRAHLLLGPRNGYKPQVAPDTVNTAMQLAPKGCVRRIGLRESLLDIQAAQTSSNPHDSIQVTNAFHKSYHLG